MQIGSVAYQSAFIVGGVGGIGVGTQLPETPALLVAGTGATLMLANMFNREMPAAWRGPMSLAGALGGAVLVGTAVGLAIRPEPAAPS